MNETALYIINLLIGLVVFFGGMWVRDLAQAVKDLRMADQQLVNRLGDFVPKNDFKEFRAEHNDTLRGMRDEQRDLFRQVFDKLDQVTSQIANKADRHEVNR